MLVSKAANCETMAGPQSTDTITETMFMRLNPLNNSENVIHEIIPVISLKNTFSTPTSNLLAGVVEFTGCINTVAGNVQNTIVVPKIAIIVPTFDVIACVLC